jgi:hypothetical protein
MSIVEFGEFKPDEQALNNTGVTLAKGVVPGGNTYKSFASPAVYSTNTIDAPCQGGISVRDNTGNAYTYVGNASKLYEMSSASFADRSKVGGYNTANDQTWEFVKWNEKLLATNYGDPIQTITIGGPNFADLGGSPPKAKHIAIVGNFVVLGNIFDTSDGEVPYRVQWSGFEDETVWGVDPVTQTDFEDLEEVGGAIQKIVGGSYGLIFRETSIHKMTYVGSPLVFQFDLIEANRGTLAPGSVIKFGNLIAYLANDGFYVFDGTNSVPIGENKVNKFFFDDLDTLYYHKIFTVHDPFRQIIYWAYPGAGNTEGRPNKFLIYNYSPNSKKRWSYVDGQDVSYLFNSFIEGLTLDDLIPPTYPSLDALEFSLDSPVWIGRTTLLSGFNSDNYLVNFSGDAVDATIETPEFQLFDGNRGNLTAVRPIIEGEATVTLQVGTRNLQSEDVTWSAVKSLNSGGEIPCRENARYHRLRILTTGNFDNAMGFEIVKSTKSGRR